MRLIKFWFICLISLSICTIGYGHVPKDKDGKKKSRKNNDATHATLREPCSTGGSQIAQDVNNVRARLLINGDCWWDGSNARYVIPKVEPPLPQVSAVFAGAVWLGGVDDGGNLKVAGKTYGFQADTDFWPGPILDFLIEDGDTSFVATNSDICDDWDNHFEVLGRDIDEHIRLFNQALDAEEEYKPEDVPEAVLGWPAKGNPFFFDVHDFELPNTLQGLAGFFDADGDDLYDATQGDYPIIEIRGCPPQYADEMIFWIYNDVGNVHTESDGDPMEMEVQVQSFAYATNDEINNMTFQRFKLINRATESIDSTFFAMWVDPDLGCATDDYVGCDTTRSLAYIYNSDGVDGTVDLSCDCGGTPTYCLNIPVLGVDYFRGPLDEFANEIGMSSFTYYNNGGGGGKDDPGQAAEYYNYISGSWRDGTPFTAGGDAYDPTSTNYINYAFPSTPDDPNGWSMATEALANGDRRTLQASGPFRLDPGATNELIIGVVWVPDIDHPSPDITQLLFADDIAQSLFDNCFDITDGPDAPDVDWIELNQELIAIFTNDSIISNNAFEEYEEEDLRAPGGIDDPLYRFEGYKLIQLRYAGASLQDENNARVVRQVDLKNGVDIIYNWGAVKNPNPLSPLGFIWVPEAQVEGLDEGLRHTFRITEDAFTNQPLINHKKYYYVALAYAYNNYEEFDAATVVGQRFPYLEGRRNIGDIAANLPYYTVIPRPIIDIKLNAEYGDEPIITRIDGEGAGSNFLDVSKDTREAILDGSHNGIITYLPGEGPINVTVFNPLGVVNGTYRLAFYDEDLSNNTLDQEVRWRLTDGEGVTTESETTIARFNEQVFKDYGFTVNIVQTAEAGDQTQATNGAIGYEIAYSDPNESEWLAFIPSLDNFGLPFNYVQTGSNESDANLDVAGALSNVADGLWVPYGLTSWRVPPNPFVNYIMSPAWQTGNNNNETVRALGGLNRLNNVDIVFTSDKSKWSRCVIVESGNKYYRTDLGIQSEGNQKSFELRESPSVGKEAGADGKPLPDGELDDNDNLVEGKGWFPGYAVDIETGKRLNIFFAENSVYDCSHDSIKVLCDAGKFDAPPTGRDMMWNPNPQFFVETDNTTFPTALNYYTGGQHFIYVTDEEYDGCAELHRQLDGNIVDEIEGKAKITWTSYPLPTEPLLSYADGLIPSEVTIKLRVDNPYEVELGTEERDGYPTYEFTFDNVAHDELTSQVEFDSALAVINVVPNPYYGFSEYEVDKFTNVVKITNLPAKCTVTIYTLDGKFIRQYNRDEIGTVPQGSNRPLSTNQILPDLEWDLRNNKLIPVASGVYLIHVDAPGLGERTLKWFGIARQFDPTGL